MIWEVSLQNIDEFAATFWQAMPQGRVFAFHGDMGAGKTTIINALCRKKGVTDAVSSPTYSIINEYRYAINGFEKVIYHIDLYRLNDAEEIAQTGVADCIDSSAICFVEWPQKAPELFNHDTINVFITPLQNNQREVKAVFTAAV